MTRILYILVMIPIVCALEEDYFYSFRSNVSRATPHGIAEYRSALTLDWLSAEDHRQRELAAAFETEASPAKIISSDCISYPTPTAGRVARLMLELLKNLEGDDGVLVPELMHVLIKTKLLLETSIFDSEPDFDSLVKTPDMMMGEPHTTFPRILAIIWMLVTDPVTTNKYGWCPIKKVNKYLSSTKSYEVAKQMRAMEIVVARARFIMEEFIQSVTPASMYQKTTKGKKSPRTLLTPQGVKHGKKRAHDLVPFPIYPQAQTKSPPVISPVEEIIDSSNAIDSSIALTNYSKRNHAVLYLYFWLCISCNKQLFYSYLFYCTVAYETLKEARVTSRGKL